MRKQIYSSLIALLFIFFTLPLYADQLIIEPDMGRQPLIEAINNAHQSIEMVMYGFTDQTLLKKLIQQKTQGRTLKIILEKKPYKAESENIKTIAALKQHDIAWLGSIPSVRLIHQKTLILDKEKAIVMTFNFTRSAFKNERNFALVVDDPERVKQIAAIFSSDWNHVPALTSSSELLLSPDNSRKKLLDIISQTQHSLQIYAQDISDYKIVGALAKAAKKGVSVQLLSSSKLRENQENYLKRAGVKIHYTHQYLIHAKVFIIDQEKAILGSINLTRSSFEDNRELSLLTQDVSVINGLIKTFNHDWDNAKNPNGPSRQTWIVEKKWLKPLMHYFRHP